MNGKQIKFRKWNDKTKKLIYSDDFYEIYEFFQTFYAEDEAMQYTGLNDKNDEDIYEGDIIKDKWEEKFPKSKLPKKWNDVEKLFVVKYNSSLFIFSKKDDNNCCIKNHTWEIVGNIFENVVLLKDKIKKTLTKSKKHNKLSRVIKVTKINKPKEKKK